MSNLEIDGYCQAVLVAIAKFPDPVSWYGIEQRLHVPSETKRGYLVSAIAALVAAGLIEAVVVADQKQPLRHQLTHKGNAYLRSLAQAVIR
jgi:DNA-binding PadR family transcriptional regulator